MESVEQPGPWRRTVLWTQSRPGGGRLAIHVGQDPLNHRRIFNTGYDLNLAGAPLAGLDVDPDAAQSNTRLSRCIHVIDAWRSAGVLSSQLSPVG